MVLLNEMDQDGKNKRDVFVFKVFIEIFLFFLIITKIQTRLMGSNRRPCRASSILRVTCHIKDASCLLSEKIFLKDGHTDVNAKGIFETEIAAPVIPVIF